jgi:antitoxin (DNA-binding transcriptional repressor) of toxin-antitoxin stability system
MGRLAMQVNRVDAKILLSQLVQAALAGEAFIIASHCRLT